LPTLEKAKCEALKPLEAYLELWVLAMGLSIPYFAFIYNIDLAGNGEANSQEGRLE